MLKRALAAAAMIAAGVIAGCGSGGGTTASSVSGVAATGAPMSGTAYLRDATGNPEMSAQINPQSGAFIFDVSGKTPPFMIRAGEFYSMSGGPGTANVNPLSTLMVANMAGFGNMSTMNSFYTHPNGTTIRSMFTNMSTAREQMHQTLGPLFAAYGLTDVDPITTTYSIGNRLDRMFDDVKMTIDHSGTVTMMNLSGDPVYTGPMGNFAGGTMMSGNIMMTGSGQNASGITITPGSATMNVNGTRQFSANIPVTWSVGLNSGSITSDGLYTAPPFQGMFLVKATGIADPTKSAAAMVYAGSMGMMM